MVVDDLDRTIMFVSSNDIGGDFFRSRVGFSSTSSKLIPA